MTENGNDTTLVVDLDGTLVRTDTLLESFLDYIHRSPFGIFKVPGWLGAGKAHLKSELAQRSSINYSALPYNPDVLKLINEAKEDGRHVVLASACDQRIASGVSQHLNVFDDVIASDGTHNLSASNKKTELVNRYGEGKFDYAGNSSDDLLVWQAARSAIVVDAPKRVAAKARKHGNVIAEYNSPGNLLHSLFRAFRPHQWAKNALLFVPMLAAHAFDASSLVSTLIAFCCFCMMASGTYLINDLLDIQDDRIHTSKKNRPFAAGSLGAGSGMLWSVTLVTASLALALALLPPLFLAALISYLVITLSYSLMLKSIAALDVITLTVLYTLRIVAGSLALALEPTFWILTFSLFIFLSLALVKRYAELRDAREKGLTERSAGRGYYPSDLEIVASMGTANGFMSILFFALYIQDTNTVALYGTPEILWLICPILMFWIARLWLVTHRGEMHDDPVVYAIKDKTSLVTLLLVSTIFFVAL